MPANATTIVSAIAGAGLTGLRGVWVVIDGATKKVTLATSPAATDVFGLLLRGAEEGADVEVVVSGPTSAGFAGGVFEHGDYLTTNATGQPVIAATGNIVLGQYQGSQEVDGFPAIAAGDQVFDIYVAPVKLVAAP